MYFYILQLQAICISMIIVILEWFKYKMMVCDIIYVRFCIGFVMTDPMITFSLAFCIAWVA